MERKRNIRIVTVNYFVLFGRSHHWISDLENEKAELQKTTDELQHSTEIQENNVYNDNLNLEIE